LKNFLYEQYEYCYGKKMKAKTNSMRIFRRLLQLLRQTQARDECDVTSTICSRSGLKLLQEKPTRGEMYQRRFSMYPSCGRNIRTRTRLQGDLIDCSPLELKMSRSSADDAQSIYACVARNFLKQFGFFQISLSPARNVFQD